MLADDDSDSSSGRWDDWKSEVADEPIQSFLGIHTFATSTETWKELRDAIAWDFNTFAAERELDGYGRVRLVNFLRASAIGSDNITNSLREAVTSCKLNSGSALWVDDAFLVPVLPNDPLLMDVISFDDESVVGDDMGPAATTGEEVRAAAAAFNASVAAASAPLGLQSSLPDDVDTVASLRAELEQARSLIARLTGGGSGGSVSSGDSSGESASVCGDGGPGGASELPAFGVPPVGLRKGRRRRALSPPQDNDTYYFNSYARTGIHAVRV
jgi:hypothetical protein